MVSVKEMTDAAIQRVKDMSNEEFEKKLHEVDYYPRRLEEPVDDYLTRMQGYVKQGARPCLFDGLDSDKAYGLVCPCPKHSVTC